ncbi:MAG: TFIIB-type zinc ribbon-containing protein [Oscillospiraceae bacterium]|nr:TFIIB-type zinc ribbon-containing protein [Oscillospiraceae bacterium]
MEENNQAVSSSDEPRVIQTDAGAVDGQNKCPKCGATDIALNSNTGALRCNFCRHEFEPEKAIGLDTDLSQLTGKVVGSGTQNIAEDSNDMITFKCESCGAEVVIDTNEGLGARCHWCRNTLSINGQIPNGAVPDMVLPFSTKKEEAKEEIEKFVAKRKFYAHPKFKEEFCTQNVMGVYLPYMVVGINSRANLSGSGERLIRRYTRGSGKNQRVVFDADLYNLKREFDLVINGLTVTSSSDKLQKASDRTNNIINAIKPFDHENCVRWNANYLKGYASEKRDTDIDDLKPLVETKAKDIARHNANSSIKEYDRGVRWNNEELEIKGQQWKAAYLPMWLYSYQQVSSDGKQKKLHYVAVNARTKKTMGSIPVNMPKLFGISALVQLIGFILMFILFAINVEWGWIALFAGPLYFMGVYLKYRNSNARFSHERETKAEMGPVLKTDTLVKRLTGIPNSRMNGANNLRVNANRTASDGIKEALGDSIGVRRR